MDSLEWRLRKVENRILGELSSVTHVDRIIDQSIDRDSILDQLNNISKEYKNFIDEHGDNYFRFIELRKKHEDLLSKLMVMDDTDETSKAELVLAYEEDIIKYMSDLKIMAEKADLVLKEERWPDLSKVSSRLDKIQKINREQHIQSDIVDKKTEDLIEIYNEILGSFKSNMVLWNQRIEAYENEDRESDRE